MDDHEYVVGLAAGSLLIAQTIADARGAPTIQDQIRGIRPPFLGHTDDDEPDAKRHSKMLAVCAKKQDLLDTIAAPEDAASDQRHMDARTILRDRVRRWSPEQRTTLLIDLAFADPFDPYSLKHRDRDARLGLNRVAVVVGEQAASVDAIYDAQKAARSAHRNNTLVRVGLIGATTALFLSGIGWLAAPAIGAAIGSAAGLTGAAATAHGLALLGGGSLAAGGFGMAGGMWLVAGTGGALGLLGGAGSSVFYELGATQTRNELVKLQVSYRLVLLHGQAGTKKAQEVITNLVSQQQQLAAVLEEERTLNDDNSRRVRDLADKIESMGAAITWMRSEANNATG